MRLDELEFGRLVQLDSEVPPVLPDVPTMAESGLPAYDVRPLFGLFTPAGLPAELLQCYNEAVKGYLAQPTVNTQLAEMGASIVGNARPGIV